MAALAASTASRASPAWIARYRSALGSLATAIVILGLTMVPFFTPAWIHFEQDRAGSAALTGFAPRQVDQVTDSIVHDLVLGGDFDVRANACPRYAACPIPPSGGPLVLDPAEIAHMRDVRGVFGGFAVAVFVALAGLVIAGLRLRRASARARAAGWAAVRGGARWLAVLLLVLGVVAVTAFDAAFEVFHQVLFPGGNFDFDPRTEKLVQLFPEPFWSETALAYGALAIAAALFVAWYAGRRVAMASSAAEMRT